MAYPAVRTTIEDDNVVFSFHRRQFFTSDQAEALERQSSFCTRRRRTAQNVFLRRKSLPRRKRNKETLNALLLLEKTRIRNVRRTSKHFPTIKVEFITNITLINLISVRYARWAVSRNATNDVRTESERFAYGSRPYKQFPIFGWGVSVHSARNFKPHISDG